MEDCSRRKHVTVRLLSKDPPQEKNLQEVLKFCLQIPRKEESRRADSNR